MTAAPPNSLDMMPVIVTWLDGLCGSNHWLFPVGTSSFIADDIVDARCKHDAGCVYAATYDYDTMMENTSMMPNARMMSNTTVMLDATMMPNPVHKMQDADTKQSSAVTSNPFELLQPAPGLYKDVLLMACHHCGQLLRSCCRQFSCTCSFAAPEVVFPCSLQQSCSKFPVTLVFSLAYQIIFMLLVS